MYNCIHPDIVLMRNTNISSFHRYSANELYLIYFIFSIALRIRISVQNKHKITELLVVGKITSTRYIVCIICTIVCRT